MLHSTTEGGRKCVFKGLTMPLVKWNWVLSSYLFSCSHLKKMGITGSGDKRDFYFYFILFFCPLANTFLMLYMKKKVNVKRHLSPVRQFFLLSFFFSSSLFTRKIV